MKIKLLATSLMAIAGLVQAQEVGKVISSTPVIQQVGVPRRVCTTDQVSVQPPNSGAGAALGAIVGGAVGNASGRGPGQAAATVLGMVGGAIVGDRIEGAAPAQVQNVQRCYVQTFYENRTVAYNVTYEFGGRQYTTQMPNDPGPSIQLQVTPVGSVTAQAGPAPMPYQSAQEVIVAPPVQRGYYIQPYYPPITLELGYGGYWGGHRHWR